jgi:hypothetical protein
MATYIEGEFFNIHYTNNLYINGQDVLYNLATSTVRNLIAHAQPYAWNRPVNEDHVNIMESELKAMKKPHLIGTIKILNCLNKYFIYDGQHRFRAIKNILKDDLDMNWDMDISLEIYFIEEPDIENSAVAKYLFESANKTYSFDKARDSEDNYLKEFVNEIVKDPFFKDLIKEEICNRPRISKGDFYKEFRKHYLPKTRITIPELIELVKRKNNELSLMPVEEITGKNEASTYYKSAKKIRFFLNLKTYPPAQWIPQLN